MMTNVIDTEKLGSYIVELKNLHTEWAAKNIVMPDVGECGGSTIIQIEEMGKQYQKMQDKRINPFARNPMIISS